MQRMLTCRALDSVTDGVHGALQADTPLSSPAVQPGLIYTGSDDSSWKAWDLRSSCSGAEQSPVWTNRRTHGAGVTSITSHPRHPHVVVTGSYDEYARVWDMRMASRPVSTAEVCGGRPVTVNIWVIIHAAHLQKPPLQHCLRACLPACLPASLLAGWLACFAPPSQLALLVWRFACLLLSAWANYM
jgi:hypothetical protein